MLPRSDLLTLGAAFLAFLLSVYLWFVSEQHDAALFVAIWVPSILSSGIFIRQSLQMRRQSGSRQQPREDQP
ncbi:MAG: hypothetical protein AB7K09_24090 [Planctomycetota bacterium]